MKKALLFLLTIVCLSVTAQKTIIKEFKLSNGLTKNVKIYIPRNYETDTIHKNPIMVVLDDSYLFDITKGNAKLFANADLAPKQIVVGVPTDLAPNKDVSIIEKTLGLTRNSKLFYKFIKNDILTYIRSTYKTSPFTSIVAQGKAANFAYYFLSEPTPTFNAYICVNPYLNDSKNAFIESFNLKRFEKGENTYFLYMSSNPYQKKESKDAFKNLNTGIDSYELKQLKTKFDSFKGVPNSLSAISGSIPRAFTLIFELYRNISKQEFETKIKELPPLEAIEYLENKYIDIDYLYGTNTNVRLEDFYAIEGIVTDQQEGDYLRVLGDFALVKHPESPLGDYYMGKFYELGKDYEKAKEYYKYGYGKMDPSDKNTDAFYQNIDRVQKLLDANGGKNPPDQEIPMDEEENNEENNPDEKNPDEENNNEENNDDGE